MQLFMRANQVEVAWQLLMPDRTSHAAMLVARGVCQFSAQSPKNGVGFDRVELVYQRYATDGHR
jgi:hypothetical protein